MRESSPALVGAEVSQEGEFSVKLTQEEFAKSSEPLPTTPELWAARRRALSPESAKLRQRKLGELCWLATDSRPDSFTRRTRIAFRANPLRGMDVYRINDLVKTAQVSQQAAI